MSKREHISQLIRKYLNGELDARAMHQLEKEAQNDPFLMEALEGYDQSAADQQQNLADVYRRLHDRTHKAERRIIPWRWISIAASVLVILTIGGLLLMHQSPETRNTVVKASKPNQTTPIIKPAPVDTVENVIHEQGITKQIAKNKVPVISKTYRYAPLVVNENKALPAPILAAAKPAEPKTDSTKSLGEVVVTGYSTLKKATVTGSAQTIPQDYLAKKDIPEINNSLEGKVAGLAVIQNNNKQFTGIVTGKDDGLPIPGVLVQIKGSTIGTQTDSRGHFTLSSVPDGAVLTFSFVGYLPQQMVADKNKMLAVNLQPNTASLSEVVVTGYGSQKKQDEELPVYEGAHPAAGWSNYKKYLKDNAKSPDGKTGVVRVSFKVDQYGSLSDFKIRKSLSAEADNAAIRLIQNGPRWLSNTNRTSETVTVKVRFEAAQ